VRYRNNQRRRLQVRLSGIVLMHVTAH
jgi:hypothetical protein